MTDDDKIRPDAVGAVVNCGSAGEGEAVEVPVRLLSKTVRQHVEENAVAAKAAAAEWEREQEQRADEERQAAKAAAEASARQAALLSELAVRARQSPDVALVAKLLGVPVQ